MSRRELLMGGFVQYERDGAPEGSRALLDEVAEDFGMVPNLERTLATAPAALEGYVRLWGLFEQTSLTPVERQVVYQVTNFENGCRYCVPWHTLLAQRAGMEEADVQALRDGGELGDEKLEALRRFVKAVVDGRGRVPAAVEEAFYAAGYVEAQALEVVLGLATKVMSNYTNAIAGTPLDREVEHLVWEKPVGKL